MIRGWVQKRMTSGLSSGGSDGEESGREAGEEEIAISSINLRTAGSFAVKSTEKSPRISVRIVLPRMNLIL